MPRLIILASPFSARNFFHAVRLAIKGTMLTRTHCSFYHFPETKQLVHRIEKRAYEIKMLDRQRKRLPIFRRLHRWLLALQYNGWCRLFQQNTNTVAMCWNGTEGRRKLFCEAAKRSGVKILFLELSPLPGYLCCDPVGINFNNSLPRHKDFYLKWLEGKNVPIDSKRWIHLREKIVPRAVHRKHRKSQQQPHSSIPKNKFVFCPLQVPSDSQVRTHGNWIQGVPHMVEVLHQASRHLPDDWSLLLKEHPSAKVRLSHFPTDKQFKWVNDLPTFDLVKSCNGVITLNSSVGLQAFLYHCPVLVLGDAFYDFHPMAIKVLNQNHLNKLISQPDTWNFDSCVREAFLGYLTEVYYLPAYLHKKQLSQKAIAKIETLISN